jgi:hypothetical protein
MSTSIGQCKSAWLFSYLIIGETIHDFIGACQMDELTTDEMLKIPWKSKGHENRYSKPMVIRRSYP